jgi:hypothetical protein
MKSILLKNEQELNGVDFDNSYIENYLTGQYVIDLVLKLESFLNKSVNDIKNEDKDKIIQFYSNLKINQKLYIVDFFLAEYGLCDDNSEKNLIIQNILTDHIFDEVRDILFILSDDDNDDKNDLDKININFYYKYYYSE